MSVPDPLSVACELGRCHVCPGEGWDHLKDIKAPCRCACHRQERRQR